MPFYHHFRPAFIAFSSLTFFFLLSLSLTHSHPVVSHVLGEKVFLSLSFSLLPFLSLTVASQSFIFSTAAAHFHCIIDNHSWMDLQKFASKKKKKGRREKMKQKKNSIWNHRHQTHSLIHTQKKGFHNCQHDFIYNSHSKNWMGGVVVGKKNEGGKKSQSCHPSSDTKRKKKKFSTSPFWRCNRPWLFISLVGCSLFLSFSLLCVSMLV